MSLKNHRKNLLAIALSSAISLCYCITPAYADDVNSFTVNKINVEGLQRISRDTVISYLPIKLGSTIDSTKTAEIIRSLYKTGFFNNVNLIQQGNVLIIKVAERPIISSLNISGNKQITKKQLQDALKNSGFKEGQPYDDAIIYSLKEALAQQYATMGYRDTSIDVKVQNLARNRVNVDIKVTEGVVAKVREIKIFGNKSFSSSKLLKNFSLSTGSIFSFLTDSDKYSRDKLSRDLEALQAFYLDNGYLQFKVDATKVSVTPDKKNVYISLYLNEGPMYKISGWGIKGNTLNKDWQIRKLITIRKGDVFSRQNIINITNLIGKFLGNYGYAMPNVQGEPQIDEVNHTIFINFNVNPGKRIYVRRIDFSGNTKTHETVLRRELRQQEGALYSAANLEESKRRLNNLGYVQDVEEKMEPVSDSPDQVDITYNLKETSSVMASAQVGYGDTDGFIYGASLNDQNFFGTGKGVGVQFNHNKYAYGYSMTYFDPYFTQNNVSLNVSLYNQRTDPAALNLSSYTTTSYGALATFGIPITEYNRVNLGYGFEHITVNTNSNSSIQAQDFIQQYGNNFSTAKLNAGWSYTKLDRAIFPTEGLASNLSLEIDIPIGKNKLQYYKGNYDVVYYQPIIKSFVLRAGAGLGYGQGYGGMKNLPFFKNYFAGGIGSVRGYEGNSLGPLDNLGNPTGGNVLTDASLGLIFPNPLGETVRSSLFVDTGNVYYNQLVIKDMRTSFGMQVEWRSPMGVITVAIATPITKHTSDRLRAFAFNMGASI